MRALHYRTAQSYGSSQLAPYIPAAAKALLVWSGLCLVYFRLISIAGRYSALAEAQASIIP